MQVRWFAIAALLVAALAALGWFALRGAGSRAAALDAPAPLETARPPRASVALESSVAASNGAPDAQRSPLLPDSIPTLIEPTPPGHPGPKFGGLIVRVLTPSGNPLAGALVSHVSRTNVVSVAFPQPTDSSGHLRIGGTPDSSIDIRASDPQGRFAPAYAFEIHGEDRTLDMQLEEATTRTLIVVDEEERPVERFAWRMLDERQYRSHRSGKLPVDELGLQCDTSIDDGTGSFAPAEKDEQTHSGGRVALHTGSLAFVVQVDAEDFAPTQVGPFAAMAAPSEIRVVLQRAPGIRGRVLFDGQAVAAAWVKLQRTSEEEHAPLINGFASRVVPWPVSQARTEADGSFLLPLRASGEYVIQAGVEGKGSAESSPRRFSAAVGAAGIELVLPACGAIEGRLLLEKGELERYRIVAASCGDGQARTVHVDDDGRFRFGDLRPGSWVLHPSDTDLHPDEVHSMTIRPSAALVDPEPVCEVLPGQTARVEIELRKKATLVVNLRLAGWEGAKRDLRLGALGRTYGRGASDDDSRGSPRLVVDQPGDYLLTVALESAEPAWSLFLEEKLDLDAGENIWSLEGQAGELLLSNALDSPAVAWLGCELGGTRMARASVRLGPHEERRLAGLPLGAWKALRFRDRKELEGDSVQVTAAGGARLEWK